jgi:hypothetical protein
MIDPVLDLGNNLNWNLALKTDLNAVPTGVADEFYSMPPRFFGSPSNIVLIGAKSNTAKPNWRLAARVQVRANIGNFDSTSEFPGLVTVYNTNLLLSELKLLHWRKYQSDNYTVRLNFPYWLSHVYVEAYWYDGPQSDNHLALLEEINGKLG